MCADSLTKIKTSSMSNVSNGKGDSFNDTKHAKSLFSRFAKFYYEGKFTDVVLTGCDHKKFQVHSVILAAASDFLCKMFSSVEHEYHLDFVESESLDAIIRFCYTGEISLSAKNIQSILYAANDLGMQRLKRVCNQFFESTTDSEHLLQFAIAAEKCGLNSSKELAKKFVLSCCNRICESNELQHLNTNNLNDVIVNLCTNQSDMFSSLIQLLNFENFENNSLLLNSYQAIYQLFFIAGYIQSLTNVPGMPPNLPKPPALIRSNTVDIITEPRPGPELCDEGLFIIAKSKLDGLEIYTITESNGTLRTMPKYHINFEKIYIETLKIFPNKDKIYLSFIKEQKLVIKSWNFKRQNVLDSSPPSSVQLLRPRLTNAVGDTFFVAEEKYVTWPYEGYKTTACKFGVETDTYKCIEANCGGVKEIIGIGDEIFVFNQKAEVFSFNLTTGKRVPRGALSHNGIIKAVIYHGQIYVGCYVRSKCTIFVERFDQKNEWTMVRSICSYTDASNYHIGSTENFLYLFCGKGKVQRFNDISDQWFAFNMPENFNQAVLCISTSPFTCVLNKF